MTLSKEPHYAEMHRVPDDYKFTSAELKCIINGDMFTPRQAAIMARELLERRERDKRESDIGEIRVGRLPTMNQDEYPGLGDWWVQLRIGEDSEEVLARVYGSTPQEANNRAYALACRAAMLKGGHS